MVSSSFTFKTNRVGVSPAAFFGAAMLCGVSALASAGQRHVITVTPSPYATERWSVYGDLYNGKGQKVYHWQETGKKAGEDHVRWEYNDGGDGGWVNIWVDASPAQRASYLHLPLNKNHCYRIAPPVYGFSDVVEVPRCGF